MREGTRERARASERVTDESRDLDGEGERERQRKGGSDRRSGPAAALSSLSLLASPLLPHDPIARCAFIPASPSCYSAFAISSSRVSSSPLPCCAIVSCGKGVRERESGYIGRREKENSSPLRRLPHKKARIERRISCRRILCSSLLSSWRLSCGAESSGGRR